MTPKMPCAKVQDTWAVPQPLLESLADGSLRRWTASLFDALMLCCPLRDRENLSYLGGIRCSVEDVGAPAPCAYNPRAPVFIREVLTKDSLNQPLPTFNASTLLLGRLSLSLYSCGSTSLLWNLSSSKTLNLEGTDGAAGLKGLMGQTHGKSPSPPPLHAFASTVLLITQVLFAQLPLSLLDGLRGQGVRRSAGRWRT